MVPDIYIAASSKELPRAKLWIAKLSEEGFRITYDWTVPVEEFGSEGSVLREAQLRMYARADLRGIDEANVFWLLAPTEAPTIGGWIELGYALDQSKTIVVSPPVSDKVIFCRLPVVREFEDDEKAFEFINTL